MAKTLQKKIKFSKGQVSPELLERTDLTFYDSSAQEMKNVVSTIYGGVRTRRGTKYVDYITDIDEIAPDSINSDIFNDTSHFTDLTVNTSGTLSTNKLLAEIDYGANDDGTCRIEIKGIKIVPFKFSSATPGTTSVTLEPGTYKVTMVGGGGGSAASGGGGGDSIGNLYVNAKEGA